MCNRGPRGYMGPSSNENEIFTKIRAFRNNLFDEIKQNMNNENEVEEVFNIIDDHISKIGKELEERDKEINYDYAHKFVELQYEDHIERGVVLDYNKNTNILKVNVANSEGTSTTIKYVPVYSILFREYEPWDSNKHSIPLLVGQIVRDKQAKDIILMIITQQEDCVKIGSHYYNYKELFDKYEFYHTGLPCGAIKQ